MLQKESLKLNFASGLDTKTDPLQVAPGKMLALQNAIFTKAGLLQKRNGFQQLNSLPNDSFEYLTSFNGDLTAIGSSIAAYSSDTETWASTGSIQPLNLSTLPLIRNGVNQIQCDAAVASNGLVCTVYTETNGSTTVYKYAVADSLTGQNIIAPSLIVPGSTLSVSGSPRVFILSNWFVIVYTAIVSSTSHLQYSTIAINNPTVASTGVDIVSSYSPASGLDWDGVVVNSNLYLAWNTVTGGQSVQITYLTSNLVVAVPTVFTGGKASLLSLCADTAIPQSPIIYISFFNSSSDDIYLASVDRNLNIIGSVSIAGPTSMTNIASVVNEGMCNVFLEVSNNYGYDSSIPSHTIYQIIVQGGTVIYDAAILRGVGLASKAFSLNDSFYFLASYQSAYQPTYFLINAKATNPGEPIVIAKLAYENGGGYLTLGLPSVSINNGLVQIPYLYKDFIEALSTLSNSAQTTSPIVYSQTGINLASFQFTSPAIDFSEIGDSLNIGGGFLWMYDGYLPVEQNFFLWPDSVEAKWSDTGGSMTANPTGWVVNEPSYYYQVIYTWTDNQGNIHRSAPSIPVPITFSSSDSSTQGSVTLNIPTLRLTYKTASPVVIEVYRWSVDSQTYYQISQSSTQSNPTLAPILNNLAVDYVTVVDTWASASIQGNAIIYTTGGVLEDVNPPATHILTHFDTRLWLVDDENPNNFWFSKILIPSVPVEMSDLLTMYVSPTVGSQGNVGPITAAAPLDDKLVIFFNNAIFYINGVGPDSTGANSQYSQPIFVTSTVGCTNQQSIVFIPQGLLFQSDKGIWLLGRDLVTSYIGQAVEQFNGYTVQSAINVPGTNQVRFTLQNGPTLLYDYFYGQWGTFVNILAISSTLYQNLHTFINQYGQVFQELPGSYVDGEQPVLMSFTTAWFSLAGLQGFERAYFFYLLSTYLSPHKLQVGIAYDYDSAIVQTTTISPTNYNPPYGSDPTYGSSSPYGGNSTVEQWRVFLQRQKCQAFQLTITEMFDPSYGTSPGAGFTMSGINLVVGMKKAYVPKSAARSVG